MSRLILIALVVLFVVWLVKRALASGAPSRPPADAPKGDLVACAHCGVNLPRSEARSAGGRHYCSEEHWRLGPKES
jgi:uncharacterized protein